jgi:SAM-dependent methyltransferase
VPANQANLDYHKGKTAQGESYAEAKLRRLHLPDLKGKRFLDLGCNSGYYCAQAQLAGARRVAGVDIDKGVIATAREVYPRIEFFDEGWDHIPDGEFDVIILLSAIHYAADPVAVIKDVRSHLAATGLLILEGGLLDPEGLWQTDCLIPGWRKVGDRCRHLSYGYLKRHLLTQFDWAIEGASEARGGDDVPRFVIHAKPSTSPHTAASGYSVDLVQYMRGVALSAETIVPAQPAYAYVSSLKGQASVSRELVDTMLRSASWFEKIADDMAFAVGVGSPLRLVLLPTVDSTLLRRLEQALRQRGVNVTSEG